MENNWTLRHVGVVVRDMDKAIEYYQSHGIGPFSPGTSHDTKSGRFLDVMVDGKPADPNLKFRSRSAEMGPIMLELLSPIEGELIYKQFLNSKGEGAHHICFTVDDLDKETAKLVEKGFKVIFGAKWPDGRGFAYFDTDKVGGVVFELSQRPPE